MNPGEWVAVVAAAAGVSTAVSTAVTAYLDIRRRPEADWAFEGSWQWMQNPYARNDDDPPAFCGTLTNAGDGPAFRVQVRGEECSARLAERVGGSSITGASHRNLSFAAVLHPGDSVDVFVSATPGAAREARVVVEWTSPPTRVGKRRAQTLVLADYSELGKRPEWDEESGTYV